MRRFDELEQHYEGSRHDGGGKSRRDEHGGGHGHGSSRRDGGGRVVEPPTLAFRLKPFRMAMQQLRPIFRQLRDCATVTFTPVPSLMVQSVRNHFVFKVTLARSCMYLTDPNFSVKTINNMVPLLGNLMQVSSNKDLTKFYVQDVSDLSARICMAAPDFVMDCSSACIHNQDLVSSGRGKKNVRIELDVNVVAEIAKWLAPHTRPKRSANKKQPVACNVPVQIMVACAPPVLKFVLPGTHELEFTGGKHNRLVFVYVQPMRLTVQAKNLQQALVNCMVTKSTCVLHMFLEPDLMCHLESSTAYYQVENFLTGEPFYRHQSDFGAGGTTVLDDDDEASAVPGESGDASMSGGAFDDGGGSGGHDGPSCGGGGGGDEDTGPIGGGNGGRDRPRYDGGHKGRYQENSGHVRYDQHKITSYLSSLGSKEDTYAGGRRGGSDLSHGGLKTPQADRRDSYFSNEAKEESDSEDSVTFEFVASKKAKCSN